MDENQLELLPGYQIVEKTGEGGMASVWTARQTSLDRIVAIKILNRELTQNPDEVKRFHAEAVAAAKLRHPGIVQVFDAGEHQGAVYFVMEYVPGITVAELLERKKSLPENTALGLVEAIALALEYAVDHAGIIHCDIKPGNIMIERDGTVKVADLGLSQVVGSVAFDRGHADIMGTPNYTSPEQARGFGDLDCGTDIYALGAMLYHMVTGQLPFGDSPPGKVMEKQLFGYLPDPKELNVDLSSGICWLIEKMMIKDRTLRSQNWQEVITDIHEVSNGGVPSGKMPSAGHSTVLRGEVRAQEPSATQRILASEIAKREAEEARTQKKPKQQIVLPKDLRAQLKKRQKEKKKDSGPVLLKLILLLFLVAGGYGIVTYIMSTGDQDGTIIWENGQAAAPVVKGSHALSPRSSKAPTARQDSFRPASTERSKVSRKAGTSSTIQWKNSDFRRGAKAFNRGLKNFKEFQATKRNPGILKSVEQDCRTAISAFEACRDEAPPEINVSQYIDHCYHLISDCRQSTLLIPSTRGPKKSARKSFGERAAERQRAAQNAPPPGVPKKGQLCLAPTWQMSNVKKGKEAEDLYSLLKAHGRPRVNLDGDPSIRLLDQVYYLMPLREACSALGIRPSRRRSLSSSAFPKNSFFYYSGTGKFGGGFDRLLLVTDNKEQVVAVELISDSPDARLWFEPQNYSTDWRAYNFILGKSKGNAKWRIAHVVQKEGDVVVINSELVGYDASGYFELGQPKSRISLILAQPLVDLLLHMAEK